MPDAVVSLLALAGAAGVVALGLLGLRRGPDAGDAAPPFSLPGSDGRTHGLEEHRGRRAVVLAWFPKAFTPG